MPRILQIGHFVNIRRLLDGLAKRRKEGWIGLFPSLEALLLGVARKQATRRHKAAFQPHSEMRSSWLAGQVEGAGAAIPVEISAWLPIRWPARGGLRSGGTPSWADQGRRRVTDAPAHALSMLARMGGAWGAS